MYLSIDFDSKYSQISNEFLFITVVLYLFPSSFKTHDSDPELVNLAGTGWHANKPKYCVRI